MEPQPTQSTARSPESNLPRGTQRCRARNRNRSQCRLRAQDPAVGLCYRHAVRADHASDDPQDTTDLSKEILVVNDGNYGTVENINAILSNVVELIAKGRISPRRAAVITYALSLMLRGVVVLDRQDANAPHRFILDAPRFARENVQPDPVSQERASPVSQPQQ